ncbi:MAG: hypothetical protein HY926_06000 [Elusimicrobia bacterium]|nr:hypothetical protein [Elusimicrobiota bacterium]
MRSGFERAQVVVLSGVDWSAAWQRHQIFASQLAAAGHDVFFVENTGFRGPGPSDLGRVWDRLKSLAAPRRAGLPQNLRVIAPRVLPPTGRAFRRCNSAILIPGIVSALRAAGLRPGPLLIAYLPTATSLALIRGLDPRVTVYDCAANFRAHPGAPADLPTQESELLARADLVVCDSDFLYQQKRAEHSNVVQVHQGVPDAFFAVEPPDPRFRRLCYFGTWGPDHDPAYLAALCEAGFEVTVHGPGKGAAPLPAGARRSPPIGYDGLAPLLERFDGFLLPYRKDPFLLGVIPAKLYECLAMGRPILATSLPCFAPLGRLVHVSDDPSGWVSIARDLPRTETSALREERIALAREHSQSREFQRLLAALRAAWEK